MIGNVVSVLARRTSSVARLLSGAPDNPPAMRSRYQIRSAPLVVGDKVIQGVTASFVPKGGFILAIDIFVFTGLHPGSFCLLKGAISKTSVTLGRLEHFFMSFV